MVLAGHYYKTLNKLMHLIKHLYLKINIWYLTSVFENEWCVLVKRNIFIWCSAKQLPCVFPSYYSQLSAHILRQCFDHKFSLNRYFIATRYNLMKKKPAVGVSALSYWLSPARSQCSPFWWLLGRFCWGFSVLWVPVTKWLMAPQVWLWNIFMLCT